MPGFYTHYLFGTTTYPHIKQHYLKQIIGEEKRAYCLGLEGPDFLFYFLPSYVFHKQNLGSILHEQRTGCFLFHLLETCDYFEDPEERQIAEAYVAGFLGHYYLDCTCHPYVYCFTDFHMKKNQRYYSKHIEFETELDRKLLEHYLHCKPSRIPQHQVIRLSGKQWDVVSTLLSKALCMTFPEKFSNYSILKVAVLSMRLGTFALSDQHGLKRPVIRKLERLFWGYYPISPLIPTDTPKISQDVCNVDKQTWHNPWKPEITSNASFFDLFEDARKDYLKALAKADRLFATRKAGYAPDLLRDLKNFLGNRNYHSGLSNDNV